MPGPRLGVLVYLLLTLRHCHAFLPNFWSRILTLSWDSHTHQDMTEEALLNVTLDTLRLQGLRANGEEEADLGRPFWKAVAEVTWSNAAMDFLSSTRSDPVYHFDSEQVESATEMLRHFWRQTLLSVRAKDYVGARHSLGRLLHSLQDFYSHSNWVEMGRRSVYLHLLHEGEPATPVASEDTPTCRECFTHTCWDNLLPKLAQTHSPLLTTGYFSTHPAKPAGKCSHGGVLDSSRHQGAQGGINKDSTSQFFSPHHYLHDDAAQVATAATVALLLDLRDSVGSASFLKLFSVMQQPALVIVMDTTGSMFEEINAARTRALSIIQSRSQVFRQPGTYILVPFHDPSVGPVYETEDPEEFMRYLEDLTALGGGDEPEMCLSAVMLALTHSPPLSEIFVFTDASPKDAHLYGAVEALCLEKKSKVSFLVTEDPSLTKWKKSKRKRRETLSPERFSLYSKLSAVSGGLTVFTSNTDIQKVSTIVQDVTAQSKVTLLHVERSSSSSFSHTFLVDSAMGTVTLHLAGLMKHCVLTSPTGRSQRLPGQSGPLADLQNLQGLSRISLLPPVELGQWHLRAWAEGHITLNAIGDSRVDFLYHFAVVSNGTHPGLAQVEGSPVAGVPTFLVLTLTGLPPDAQATFSHVILLAANGEALLQVPLNTSSSPSGSVSELVGLMESVPREPFSVKLTGRDGQGNLLERVSAETIRPTHVQIRVLSEPGLVSGQTAVVRLDVCNHGPARWFVLTAKDDQGFVSERTPQRLFVGEKGSVRSGVELKPSLTSTAWPSLTLTITVQAQDSADTNYAVLHLPILPQDKDVSPPSCSPMRVEATCPDICDQAHWTVSLTLLDRGGSGLAAVQLSQGQGALTVLGQQDSTLLQGQTPLNVSTWDSPLRVRYTSTCCSWQAQIQLWDRAGNVRRCHLSSSQKGAVQDSAHVARTDMTLMMLMSVMGSVLI